MTLLFTQGDNCVSNLTYVKRAIIAISRTVLKQGIQTWYDSRLMHGIYMRMLVSMTLWSWYIVRRQKQKFSVESFRLLSKQQALNLLRYWSAVFCVTLTNCKRLYGLTTLICCCCCCRRDWKWRTNGLYSVQLLVPEHFYSVGKVRNKLLNRADCQRSEK